MLKLLAFILLLVIEQVCSVPIIPEVEDGAEMIEIEANNVLETEKENKDVIDLSFYGSAMFGEPDEKHTALMVANYTPEAYSVNPEELGTYLEGDILIPKQKVVMKNGVASQSSRWPKGIVPYKIRGNFNAHGISVIERAIAEYHRRTCIRFVPHSNQHDYITIVSGNSGCWSSVGRIGGRQEVNLQSPGCLTKLGTVIHELMHALGFLHEQNRQERDHFVSIQYQNILPSAVTNFDRSANTLAFGVPYDYGSVMHYSANAFSSNGFPTIIPTQKTGRSQMGQRDGFSAFDVEKINRMYDCGDINVPGSVPATFHPLGPVSAPSPAAGAQGALVNSFVSGILTGLGLGHDS